MVAERLFTARNVIYLALLLGGVAFFLGSSVLYVLGIKHGQLSVLYPLVSLSYIWALVWARVFFNERFTSRKLAGLCLILLGILFVGLGNR